MDGLDRLGHLAGRPMSDSVAAMPREGSAAAMLRGWVAVVPSEGLPAAMLRGWVAVVPSEGLAGGRR